LTPSSYDGSTGAEAVNCLAACLSMAAPVGSWSESSVFRAGTHTRYNLSKAYAPEEMKQGSHVRVGVHAALARES
jgi:hypothetical protein